MLQHHRRIGGQHDGDVVTSIPGVQDAEHLAPDVDDARSWVAKPARLRYVATSASMGIPRTPP
jgi:chlorite dismutase